MDIAKTAIANATAHPVLAGYIFDNSGLDLIEEVDRQNKANLSLGGTRIAECCETAVLRLGGSKDPVLAMVKYTYKWGNKPTMELTIDHGQHRNRIQACVVIWVLCVVLLFYPLVFSHRRSGPHRHVSKN